MEMTTLERKFIIMSRIAVALQRKGICAGVDFLPDLSACSIVVRLSKISDPSYVCETIFDFERTEQELLDWWAEIERV